MNTPSPSRCGSRWRWAAWRSGGQGTGCPACRPTAATSWSAIGSRRRRHDGAGAGGDGGAKGGVFGATMGLLEKFGEWRVIDTPLAESSIAGVAIGMSVNGLRPIAEFQVADFIHPAFNQVGSEAARR